MSKTSEMTGLRQELYKLFGEDKVYFRDDGKNDDVSSRFEDKGNDNIICFVHCEGGTEKHLDYYQNYGGSLGLARIKTKYLLNHEWENNCIASFYEDKELYDDTDEEEEEETIDMSKISDDVIYKEFRKRFLSLQFIDKENLEIIVNHKQRISEKKYQRFVEYCDDNAIYDRFDDMLHCVWDEFNDEEE
jgi:hypothetical protein